jgi:hypothetical protein
MQRWAGVAGLSGLAPVMAGNKIAKNTPANWKIPD